MSELDKLVEIELDKKRYLRLTMKGLIGFQKLTGVNILEGLSLDDLSLEDTAALTWACLIHEDKELTYDDVLYLVDISNIVAVMAAVSECLLQSLKTTKAGDRPLAKKSPLG